MKLPNDLNLLYINHSRYSSEWHSNLHSHSFSEILYVISGEGQFVLRDRSIEIKEDDLIIVNPYIEHTEKSKNNHPLEYIVIGISGIQFSLDRFQKTEFVISNYHNFKHNVLLYIKSLSIEFHNNDRFSEEMCQKLVEILVINILRHTQDSFHIELADQNDKATKSCIMIENYINQHFKEDITLDLLSDITYLNKYYMSHIFKQYKNQSIMAYLNDRRIEEAKFLLQTSDHSISTIASILGFNSQSYFTQAFRSHVKMSPKNYRKLHQDT